MSLLTVVTKSIMNWKTSQNRLRKLYFYYIQGVMITYINVTKTTASVRKK